jgi:hypothetical protein
LGHTLLVGFDKARGVVLVKDPTFTLRLCWKVTDRRTDGDGSWYKRMVEC